MQLNRCSFLVTICVIICLYSECECANILAIAPLPSYSHQRSFRPLWRELSLRGHRVTLLTTDPVNDKSLVNLTEIDLHGAYQIWTSYDIVKVATKHKTNPFKIFQSFADVMGALTDFMMEKWEVQQLLKNENAHFDLIMMEPFVTVGGGFARVFGCPIIAIASLDSLSHLHIHFGNAIHPVLYPDFSVPGLPDGFLQRVQAVVQELVAKLFYWYWLPIHTEWLEKYFGKNSSTIEEVFGNFSLFLISTSPVLTHVRPVTPSTIYFGGGLHVEPPKPLPKEIQNFLDSADEGVVYFSLGTNVQTTTMNDEQKSKIFEVLEELPYKVLWKCDSGNLRDVSNNVLTASWFPQQDILRHSKIKVFITQGGVQSMEEAIFANVPMVGLPFFADQMGNVQAVVNKRIGVLVDPEDFDKSTFRDAILTAANSTEFRENMKRLARLAKDQPMSGIDTAVWWTEYVLRNKDTEHLKGPSRKMPLFQYYLIDVFLFLFVVTLGFFYINFIVLKIVLKCVFSLRAHKKQKNE